MKQFLVDIALPVPLDKTFTYITPPELQPLAKAGSRVLVTFGKKTLSGVIVGFPAVAPVQGLKPLIDLLDAEPTFSEEMLRLTRWMSEYYFAPWGEVLKAATPQGLTIERTRHVRLAVEDIRSALEATKRTAPKQHAILAALQHGNDLTVAQLQKKTRASRIHAALHQMEQRGWITVEEIAKPRAKPKLEKFVQLTDGGKGSLYQLDASTDEKSGRLPPKQRALLLALSGAEQRQRVQGVLKHAGASLSTLRTLEQKGLVAITLREVVRESEYEPIEPPPHITLNQYQQHAVQTIAAAIQEVRYKTFLLHGVTGSGKTQVYIETIRLVLAAGKTAIVLVPEISLTPQTVRRFKAHFANDVAVMHSRMSVGERFDAWRLAHEARIKIVIGPRSAIFAPLRNIGLIVVDEEQEASYKQFDSTPRYNARDVAIVRASNTKAVVILGSATPSAESYHNALSGKYEMLVLPERVDNARLPSIEIVDMTKERKWVYEELKKEVKERQGEFPKRLPIVSISHVLKDKIRQRLQNNEGTILLQNRRGFSHVVECYDCGFVEQCDNCEVTLTYHVTKKHLRCHYCGFVKKPPTVCPKCGGIEIRFHAFGTQQVQQELQGLLPEARLLRMDLDTTSRKGAHNRLLMEFGTGKADILLGTQMVAKGLDFPRVTLVGVISADTQMLLPDFRSAERTFQLLTQVAGRAGRSDLAGEVIIQTLRPEHYSLKHVVSHDFPGFYREELEYRRELDYPPFSRIVLVEFKGEKENEVDHHAKKFGEFLQPSAGKYFTVLGPAEAAIPKIKNRYRTHILIKNFKSTDPSGSQLRTALVKARQQYEASALSKNKKIQLTIDVDPQGMM
ncbi:MAG: primosomal protein N' [Bacteroidota bacterium]